MIRKYNNFVFACIKINEINLNKAMNHAGEVSQKILGHKAIPLVPLLACFGNNQNEKQYEELWKSMIEKSDAVIIFDEVDQEMQKQIDYAKEIKKKIFSEIEERNGKK